MNILLAASEAVPFVKSGGLADVVGSLSAALVQNGHDCRVVMPLYDDISQEQREAMTFITSFYVQLGWRNQYCGVHRSEADGVVYYFLDNEYYFKRRGIYGFFDDAERFAFFDMAILEMLDHVDFAPQVIHCNDWQTGLIPVYLNAFYREREKYRFIKTLFTIHNIQYQGTFDKDIVADVLGLDGEKQGTVLWRENVNFMKGALEEAEAVTTVSPTYAEEILDPWFAHGLDVLLRIKQYKLSGILNGLDYREYDPVSDTKVLHNFSREKLAGKAANKQELQRHLNLEQNPDTMVIGVVSRLVGHKGIDLIQRAFGQLMQENVQIAVLGAGEWKYERFFREAAANYPGRVSVTLGFDEVLAHKIYAGADVLLMPSKSEPCGLSQLIALRYGTLPIVRLTGGLRDTVRDLWGDEGNGYTFLTYDPGDMLYAIQRACKDFAKKRKWREHVKAAMACDYSWEQSAKKYIALYESLCR